MHSVTKTVWKNTSEPQKPSGMKIVYRFKWDELPSEVKQTEEFAAVKVAELGRKNKTQYDMIKGIHDYIVSGFSYDISNEGEIHEASSMIKTGRGVCSAYTGLASKMFDAAGIENRIVIKDARAENGECHTWNMVKLGDKWYHIDVTWDDPIKLFDDGSIGYGYFLISDESIGRDHIFDRTVYPEAHEDYSENKSVPTVFSLIVGEKDNDIGETLGALTEKTQVSLKKQAFFRLTDPFIFIFFISVTVFTVSGVYLICSAVKVSHRE